MFKKLDILVIRSFIGPFIATFFITLLVLLMQFFWLYIDDFVGKGLGLDVVMKFMGYQIIVLIPLALPLAILLSSLMTFGNMGESFELVAIKSAGISLARFVRPLLWVTIALSVGALLISNYMVPVAFLKSRTLLSDIVFAKPAFDLKEGVFYDKMNGFSIKIGKKESNDSIIRDVIVYEQGNPSQDNFIIAKSGVMRVSQDKRYLEFHLKDGWRYQERGNSGIKSDYIRLGFKEYLKEFDMSSFILRETPDSVNRENANVMSMRQLNVAIDSLKKERNVTLTQMKDNTYNIFTFNNTSSKNIAKPNWDSLFKKAKKLNDLIPDSAKLQVHQQTITQISSVAGSLSNQMSLMSDKDASIRKHKIEYHRKIIYSLACLLLFLIGAPLGSIIRKGGLGTPLIVSIVFFMVFYFSTTIGEKAAKEGKLHPINGMYLAAYILLPIGLFLIYKAQRDSQLFNKEWYSRIFSTFKRYIKRT